MFLFVFNIDSIFILSWFHSSRTKPTEVTSTRALTSAQPSPSPRPTSTSQKHVRQLPPDGSYPMAKFWCPVENPSWERWPLSQFGTSQKSQGGLVVPRQCCGRVFFEWRMECTPRWVLIVSGAESESAFAMPWEWTRALLMTTLGIISDHSLIIYITVDHSSRYQNLFASNWWFDNLHLG